MQHAPYTTNFHRDRLIQDIASFVPLLRLVSILFINPLTSFLACCQSIMSDNKETAGQKIKGSTEVESKK
jgi:hypothetical protein